MRHLQLFSLFIFLLMSCAAEEVTLELTAEPGENVVAGETIKVIADGSFSSDNIEWYINGNQEYTCNKQSICQFQSVTPTNLTVEVRAAASSNDDSGVLGGVTSGLTSGLSEAPGNASKTITLSWYEEEEEETETNITTTTTTSTTTTTLQATNNTLTFSPALTNVTAGSLVIRLIGSGLPTSGLITSIVGESCGDWNLVFSFTQTSSEVLLDAPFACLTKTISTINQIVLSQGLNSGTTVKLQQDNYDGTYTDLATQTF